MNFQETNFDAIFNQFQMREFSQISPKQFIDDPLHFDFDQKQLLNLNQNQFLINSEKMKVDEKLKINKLRKIELDLVKEQQKFNIINKRREKFEQMTNFLKQKNLLSQKTKEQNIIRHDPQLKKVSRNQRVKSQKYLYSQKILQGRAKAEQMRQTNAFRIHKKNEERLKKVRLKKQEKEQHQKQKVDKVHLNQWNNHYNKLRQKLNKREPSPPDNLYRKHIQKQSKLQKLAKKHYQQNKLKQNNEIDKKTLSKNAIQTQSLPSLLLSHRKKSNIDHTNSFLKIRNPIQKTHSIQYFGLYSFSHDQKYGQNNTRYKVTNNCNSLQNLKKFIIENRSHLDPQQDQELISKIQDFLYEEEQKELAIIQQLNKKNERTVKQSTKNITTQNSIKYQKQKEQSKQQISTKEQFKKQKN